MIEKKHPFLFLCAEESVSVPLVVHAHWKLASKPYHANESDKPAVNMNSPCDNRGRQRVTPHCGHP